MLARLKTTRFGVIEILAEGWSLYFSNFAKIALILVCVYIPVNILLEVIPLDGLVASVGVSYASQVYQMIQRLLEFLIGNIATLALACLVERARHGETLSVGEALRHGLARWTSMVGTGVLSGLILLGLSLLLIVPGIIWGMYYTFWIYVVALRGLGGKAALDYSKSLVQGQWWSIFGTALVLGILAFVISLIFGLVLYQLPADPIVNILSSLVVDVISGLFIVMFIVWFLNLDFLKYPQPDAPAGLPEWEPWQKDIV
jgi:hypothetical protein